MRRASAAAALLAAAAVLAPPASAATYRVDTCGAGAQPGWESFNSGAWSWVASDGCAGGGAGMAAGIPGGALDLAGWRFTAPQDTDIAGFSLTRSYTLAAATPFGASETQVRTDGPGRGYERVHSNYATVPVYVGIATESAGGLSGQRTLSAWVHCGGGGQCTGASSIGLYGARIELRDDIAPVISAVSGTLLAAGPVKGRRTLTYGASDRGGGLLREQVLIDGVPWVDRPVDAGRCTGGVFTVLVPCPLSASSTSTLDTTQLADGPHQAELVVWDATAANAARQGPFPFVVDNVPPPANTQPPRIGGAALQGVTLTADDGTWSGDRITLTRRWQRYEDGEWNDVAGASGATYVPGAADVGFRLRLRVAAVNGEGEALALSAPTAAIAAAPAPSAGPPPSAGPSPQASPPPASPAERKAVLTAAFQTTGGTAVTLRWGERRKVAGTLRTAGGEPLAGAPVAVTSRVAGAGALSLPPSTTDAAGRFTFTVASGPSRTITFAAHGATARVTVRVIPRVTLRASTRRGVVTLSGRVSGAPPGVRKRVELQARAGRRWRPFASTRLARRGGTFRYRTRTSARAFRAVVRAERGWPFLTGASATTRG
jgi:hypothetical protein